MVIRLFDSPPRLAALKGAKRVYVYEPNSKSCEIIKTNVRANHLESVVLVHQKAVTSEAIPKGLRKF
jgi:predicted RNA methylase